MSIAIAETVAREQQPASAAELAGRIPVPVQLPVRHLSAAQAVNAIRLLGFDVAGMSSTRAWRRLDEVRKRRMKPMV